MKKILTLFCFVLNFAILHAQNVGIGTNAPATKLDVSGALALREGAAISVAAGSNTITLPSPANSVYRLTTAGSAAFSIAGISAGSDGMQLTLINATGQIMTVTNSATVQTSTGADLVATNTPAAVTMVYNATLSKWVVTAAEGFPSGATANIYSTDGTLAGARTVTMGANNLTFNAGNGNLNYTTTGNGSVAMGKSVSAIGNNSTAMGTSTSATGISSTAVGFNTTASGVFSTAMGSVTTASGSNSTAMGNESTASGDQSVAMGENSLASGYLSFAMGYNATASGTSSKSIGYLTLANGDYSTALGYNSRATGYSSTAIGSTNTASGANSTSMGAGTAASGDNSTTLGSVTTAKSYNETTIGTYNTLYTPGSATTWVATDRLFGIGNGTSGATSDAMVVLKNGNTGIGVNNPSNKLEVSGNTKTTNLTMSSGAAIGYVLQSTDALGTAAWVNPATALLANAANNGLTWNAGVTKFQLGGALVQATDIPMAGFALSLSGTGTSQFLVGTSTAPNSARIYGESNAAAYDAIRGVNTSSAAGSAFAGVSAATNGVGTTTAANLAYHSSNGFTYGVYANAGDYGAVFTKSVGIGNAIPNYSAIADLELRNIAAGAGNPATLLLRQTTSLATNGNVLANINFGDAYVTTPQSQIQVLRDAAAGSSSDMPTAMVFSTTPDASSTLTERLRIANTGAIAINGAANYGTAGNMLVSAGNGPPAWTTLNLAGGANYVSGILPSSNGGSGVNNAGTLTHASNTTITGGGTLGLGGFTLTVPATGTAVLGTGTANYLTRWTGTNTVSTGVTQDNATAVGINVAPTGTERLTVAGAALNGLNTTTTSATSGNYALHANSVSGTDAYLGYVGTPTGNGASPAAAPAGYFASSVGNPIFATSTGSGGSAVLASSTVANAVSGVISVTGFGAIRGLNTNNTTPGTTGGTGIIGAGSNQTASVLTAGSGGAFTGYFNGVAAINTSFGVSEALYTNNGGTICYVNYWSGSTQYKITGSGTVSTLAKDVNGNGITLHCTESPEIYFQDYGEGQLSNGTVHITLDPSFSKNITVNAKHPLRAFIQLNGDCKGVMTTNETENGFDVKELQGGQSNVKFHWIVVANRADEVLDNGHISRNADTRFESASAHQPLTTLESKN